MSPLDVSPVIPVVVLDDPDLAVPLARALYDGGIAIVELTLRTPGALAAIERIAAEVPEVVIGAGTVTTPRSADAATRAGAGFLVSPGTTPALLSAMRDTGLPILPGVATVSEALALREQGYDELKLFPAEAVGGPALLQAIGGPLPDLRFCPTGGITPERALDYLALPNVACVGGSWLTPAALVQRRAWAEITALAGAAVRLASGR